MLGTGGGHCAALLERSTGSDTAQISNCLASCVLQKWGWDLGGADRGSRKGKIFLERHSLRFEKQNHICKRDSASKSRCARKTVLEGLLTLHLA